MIIPIAKKKRKKKVQFTIYPNRCLKKYVWRDKKNPTKSGCPTCGVRSNLSIKWLSCYIQYIFHFNWVLIQPQTVRCPERLMLLLPPPVCGWVRHYAAWGPWRRILLELSTFAGRDIKWNRNCQKYLISQEEQSRDRNFDSGQCKYFGNSPNAFERCCRAVLQTLLFGQGKKKHGHDFFVSPFLSSWFSKGYPFVIYIY